MNAPALKVVPQVNLDEFERRLRAAGAPAGAQQDPLEELARLVGLDAYPNKSASEPASVAHEATPAAPPPRLPHIDDQLPDVDAFDRLLRVTFAEAQAGEETAAGSPPPIALEPEVEPAEASAPPVLAPSEVSSAVEPPRRSGRTKLAMGMLVGLGAVGLVAAWAVKGAPGLPRTPPLILALAGPTKVQPPTQETVATPGDTTSDLLKDETSKPDAVKLVSNEEQPVDLREQAPAAPAAATQAPPSAAAVPAAADSPAGASAAPSPALAEQIPDKPIAALATVGPAAAPAAPPAPFPEPKRVRTISVRPDGSVISNAPTASPDANAAAPADAGAARAAVADVSPTASVPPATIVAPPAAPPPAADSADSRDGAAAPSGDLATPRPANVPVPRARPSFAEAADVAAPLAATPKVELPARPAIRPPGRAPVAAIDTTVSGATSQAPESPLQLVPDLLGSVARAVSGRSTAQPLAASAAVQVASADPTPTATTTSDAAAAPKGDGAYAVQLGAPGSEQEAQSMSARLRGKYATDLGGMQPVIRQAEVNGHPIYRVRLVGMSRSEAIALCLKLKATGGDGACFVAKN